MLIIANKELLYNVTQHLKMDANKKFMQLTFEEGLLLPFLYIHTCVIFNKCIQTLNVSHHNYDHSFFEDEYIYTKHLCQSTAHVYIIIHIFGDFSNYYLGKFSCLQDIMWRNIQDVGKVYTCIILVHTCT